MIIHGLYHKDVRDKACTITYRNLQDMCENVIKLDERMSKRESPNANANGADTRDKAHKRVRVVTSQGEFELEGDNADNQGIANLIARVGFGGEGNNGQKPPNPKYEKNRAPRERWSTARDRETDQGSEKPKEKQQTEKSDERTSRMQNFWNKNACFNCGEKGHSARQCEKPRDEKRVSAGERKYLADKIARGGGQNYNEGHKGDSAQVNAKN